VFNVDGGNDADMTTAKAGGRPIDMSAAPKLMQAARDLVGLHGYAGVTIAMIADAAGVGRQTVYRRWRSKADLVLDAYLERAEIASVVADGPVTTMIETLLDQHFAGFEQDRPAIRNLIASAQTDELFRQRLEERFARAVDQAVIDILARAVERGELPVDTDVGMVTETIHGAIWYRLLLGRTLDGHFVRRLTATALHGAGHRPG
jgi:AcrR family transcriptional regulator